MNSSGKVWPHIRIRGRLSQTRTRATTAWTLASAHSFLAMTRGSARRVSKPGSLSPRQKRRWAPTSGSVKDRPICVNRPHSDEGFIYDDCKTSCDAGLSDVCPTGNQRGESDAALFEGPDGLPGKEGLMITVEYPPGSSDPIHRHNAHAFVYVLEGSIVMQVRGGKEMTLTPGQTFYEGPEDVHVVGRNASQTKPAKFLVFLVKDKGAPVLVPAI